MKYLYLLLLFSSFSFAQMQCEGVDIKVDDFTSEKVIKTKSRGYGAPNPHLSILQGVKIKANNEIVTGLQIKLLSDSLPKGDFGVYFIFEDGSKLIRENIKVDKSVAGRYYSLSAIMDLNELELKQFETLKVSKIRVINEDAEIDSSEAKDFLSDFKCLVQTNF